MKKFSLLCTSLCFLWTTLLTAQDYRLQGKVIDATTQQAIAGVAIASDEQQTQGVITDDAGQFSLVVSEFPIQLFLTHLGYREQSVVLQRSPDSILLIRLQAQAYSMEEAVVTSTKKIETLSKPEEYAAIDFELTKERILLLQYYGEFKSRGLALLDLAGKPQNLLRLSKIKDVKRLYKSCNDIVYLVTGTQAIPIYLKENKIALGDPISIDVFDTFIVSCKVQHDNALYYLTKKYNGLVQSVKKYNLTTEKVEILRVLFHEQLDNYFEEPLLGSDPSAAAIQNNDRDLNRYLRRLDAEIQFLLKVYYVPKFPNYLFVQHNKLLFFNHMDKQVEISTFDQFEQLSKVSYTDNKKWIKKIIQDEKTQQIYGLFDCKKGTELQHINPQTGVLRPVEKIKVYSHHLKKVRIYNNQLYYLKERKYAGNSVDLIRQELNLP